MAAKRGNFDPTTQNSLDLNLKNKTKQNYSVYCITIAVTPACTLFN